LFSFRVAEALAVIEWEDGTGDSSDHSGAWDIQNALKAKSSMKGLHAATTEGWLHQRARERCIFVHDKFFQAAVKHRLSLPKSIQDEMALKVMSFPIVSGIH
jgi:hypothetical protein